MTGQLPTWAIILLTVLGGGLMGTIATAIATRRRTKAESREANATADSTIVKTAAELTTMVHAQLVEMRTEFDESKRQQQTLRQDVSKERAAAAEALAELAVATADAHALRAEIATLRAQMAEDQLRAQSSRHELQDQITALQGSLARRDIEIAGLREQMETFRAQAGHVERRST